MVPLFLVFPPFQVGQIVNVVHIIEAVPVGVKQELPRIQRLQQDAVLRHHGDEPAADPPAPGVVDQGIQHRLGVPPQYGEGIGAAAVVLGKQCQALPQKRCLLPPPEIEVVKRILAAPPPAILQHGVILFFLRRVQTVKINHKNHSFIL